MIFADKVNKKIRELVVKALNENTAYNWAVIIQQCDDELWLIPRITRSDSYDWKTGCDWFNNNRESVTVIIDKATNMIWEAPDKGYEFDWTLKKGAIHWSSSDGIPGGDGTTRTGRIETIVDEFLVFEGGEFQKTIGYVDGCRDDSVDISSYDEDNWEFCEGVSI